MRKKRKKERQKKKKHDKRLLRRVPFGVDECSVVQVEVVGMCFDGQTLSDLSLCPLFFSAHNLRFIPIDGYPLFQQHVLLVHCCCLHF